MLEDKTLRRTPLQGDYGDADRAGDETVQPTERPPARLTSENRGAGDGAEIPHDRRGIPRDVRTGGGGASSDPQPVQFDRPTSLSSAQVRALEALHREAAQNATDALSTHVRTRVSVALLGASQRRFSEWIGSLNNPTCLHVVYCLPLGSPFLLECNPNLLFPLIERLLGGSGDERFHPVRPLTRIEQALARLLLDRFLGALEEPWSRRRETHFEITEYEHNPLLMQAVEPDERVLILGFQVSCDRHSSRVHICIPVQAFEETLYDLAGGRDGSGSRSRPTEENSGERRERLLEHLGESEVTVSAELEALPIELRDLLVLKPGDVIDTRIAADAQVRLLVEGRPLFQGTLTEQDGRRGVEVTG